MKENKNELTEIETKKILLSSKFKARWNTIMTLLSIILLAFPVGYLSTVIFYSIDNQANHQITALETVYALTRPNMKIDDESIENEFDPVFGLKLTAPIKSQVGDLEKNAGSYTSNIRFEKITDQRSVININQPPNNLRDKEFPFIYGKKIIPTYLNQGWDQLDKVPGGTVAEAFISFDKAYTPKEVKSFLGDKEVTIVWNAVYTGLEKKMEDSSGAVVTPIGYPEKNEPFENSNFQDKTGSALFLNQLEYLDQHKKIAQQLMGEASLASSERLDYLQKNGIKIYGVVLTGPSKNILKLKDTNKVISIYVNQVDFWHWNKGE